MGILVCSLAVWLSRGIRRDDGSEGGGGGGGGNGNGPPGNQRPPSGPDGLLAFDWDEFERDLSAWTERGKVGV